MPGGIRFRSDRGLLAAAAIGLLATAPLFRPGLPSLADAAIHLLRTAEFGQIVASGAFPPRWAPHLAYGYGYPLFIYAPPLPYLAALALSSVGLGLAGGLKAVAILAFVLGAVGAYLWGRDSLSAAAGLLAALVFSFAPLRLREAYILGGNYPQLLALSLLPLSLWAIRRSQRTGWGWPVGLTALLIGSSLLSHLFQGLVVVAVAGGYCLVLWVAERGFARLVPALAGIALGVGIGCYTLLPALLERGYVRASPAYYARASPYEGRFLDLGQMVSLPVAPDPSVANPYLPLTLNGAFVLLGLAGGAAALVRGRREVRLEAIYMMGLTLACMALNLPISLPLWRAEPLLAMAQYPWRWLSLAGASLAWLAGANLLWFRNGQAVPQRVRGTAPVLALLATAVVSLPLLVPWRPFIDHGTSVADLYHYERLTGAIGLTTLGEYMPAWVHGALDPAVHMVELESGRWPSPLASGQQGATLLWLGADGADIEVTRAEASPLRLDWLFYPGWRASLDGSPARVEPDTASGTMVAEVPAGEHRLSLRFGETRARLLADALSGACLLASMAILLLRPRRRQPTAGLPRLASLSVVAATMAVFALSASWPSGIGELGRVLFPGSLASARPAPAATFAGAAQVAAFSAPSQVAAGRSFAVTLYWRAVAPLGHDYATFVHLDAPHAAVTVAGSDNWPPGDKRTQEDLPTLSWPLNALVRDEHTLEVPADLPPGLYRLRAGMLVLGDGQRAPVSGVGADDGTVELALVRVLPARTVGVDAVPVKLTKRVGAVELLGYGLEGEAVPGGRLTLTLYWRRWSTTSADGHVFVHLAGAGGRPVAQADGPFAGGNYPPADWLPGEVVADRRELVVPSGLSSGEYELLVGVYDPGTLARWPVAGQDGADRAILLQRIAIATGRSFDAAPSGG